VKNIPQPVHAYRVELEKGSSDRTLMTDQPQTQSKAANRSTPLLIIIAGLLIAMGALGSFVILNKPWSRQEATNPTIAAVIPPPKEARTQVKRESETPQKTIPRTLFGARFVAADVPFVCDDCREKIGKALDGQPDHTALALSWDGDYFWALNRSTAADARRVALGRCLDAKRRGCFVYAVDNIIVWKEPPPSLPAKPWFIRNPQAEQPLEFDKITNLTDEQKQRMAFIYPKYQNSRALVIGALRQWTMTGGVGTDEEAARTALERCGYITHSPCRVIAINDKFVVQPASFKVDTAAAPAISLTSNASGPAYSLTGPPFASENIPFICDECRDRIAKGLKDRPLHSASVISFDGDFWYSWDRDSAEEARTIAFGDCLGSAQTMCLVYAIDSQVVSRETSPLPSKPWFTHDSQIEKPLDVETIPNLPNGAKEIIRNGYLKANPPKANAVGHCSWAQAFGVKIQIRTEEEAARIALERCGFVTQGPCRIVAINDTSVASW
jgi:hypothetical protein